MCPSARHESSTTRTWVDQMTIFDLASADLNVPSSACISLQASFSLGGCAMPRDSLEIVTAIYEHTQTARALVTRAVSGKCLQAASQPPCPKFLIPFTYFIFLFFKNFIFFGAVPIPMEPIQASPSKAKFDAPARAWLRGAHEAFAVTYHVWRLWAAQSEIL